MSSTGFFAPSERPPVPDFFNPSTLDPWFLKSLNYPRFPTFIVNSIPLIDY